MQDLKLEISPVYRTKTNFSPDIVCESFMSFDLNPPEGGGTSIYREDTQ
jgi:hypothetical protein